MTAVQAAAALVDALNRSTGASALSILARPKYPLRELRPMENADGSITLSVSKLGWNYKRRGPRPPTPPKADTAAIQAALTTALAPRFKVRAVTDRKEFIEIKLEEIA